MSNRDREQNRDKREDDRQNENWEDDRGTGAQHMGGQQQTERGSSSTPSQKPRKKK